MVLDEETMGLTIAKRALLIDKDSTHSSFSSRSHNDVHHQKMHRAGRHLLDTILRGTFDSHWRDAFCHLHTVIVTDKLSFARVA